MTANLTAAGLIPKVSINHTGFGLTGFGFYFVWNRYTHCRCFGRFWGATAHWFYTPTNKWRRIA